MKKRFTLASILLGLIMVSNAHALPNIPPPGGITKAPEISVASCASAVAFLAGVLLLVGEKRRSRRF